MKFVLSVVIVLVFFIDFAFAQSPDLNRCNGLNETTTCLQNCTQSDNCERTRCTFQCYDNLDCPQDVNSDLQEICQSWNNAHNDCLIECNFPDQVPNFNDCEGVNETAACTQRCTQSDTCELVTCVFKCYDYLDCPEDIMKQFKDSCEAFKDANSDCQIDCDFSKPPDYNECAGVEETTTCLQGCTQSDTCERTRCIFQCYDNLDCPQDVYEQLKNSCETWNDANSDCQIECNFSDEIPNVNDCKGVDEATNCLEKCNQNDVCEIIKCSFKCYDYLDCPEDIMKQLKNSCETWNDANSDCQADCDFSKPPDPQCEGIEEAKKCLEDCTQTDFCEQSQCVMRCYEKADCCQFESSSSFIAPILYVIVACIAKILL